MRLNEIYAKYKTDIEFMCIYISEAHPDDGWRVQANLDENIIYKQPTTDGERTEVAAVCQLAMDLKMPYYVDGIDNDVEEKYKSLPMRLNLIGTDGEVAYAGDRDRSVSTWTHGSKPSRNSPKGEYRRSRVNGRGRSQPAPLCLGEIGYHCCEAS